MKKKDVKVGETYIAKVSGNLVPVKITGENQYGGWDGLNTITKRDVRIKSPQRLRYPVQENKPKLEVILEQKD